MKPFMILILALAAAALAPEGGPAHFRVPAHRARANLAGFISDADYPAGAIQRGEQGLVGFELDVDPAGRVSACRITASSGSASLDEATCRIMRERAQFTPARDRRGRPAPDLVSQRVNWVLPEQANTSRARASLASYISDSDYPADAIRNGEQGIVGFQLEVGPDGIVSSCRIVASSGSASLDTATCRIMQARARFTPARDGGGHAVPDVVTSRIRWVLPPDEPDIEPDVIDLTPYITSADYPPEALRLHEQGLVGVELTVSPAGEVTSCTVTQPSGSAALDAHSCEVARARAHFMPSHDQSGRGVTSALKARILWVLPSQ